LKEGLANWLDGGMLATMKNAKSKAPLAIRQWLAVQGSKGGQAGTVEDKREAARARWSKPDAKKRQ
jgi:hypothetical protein